MFTSRIARVEYTKTTDSTTVATWNLYELLMCSFSQKGRNNIIEFDEDATLVYVEKSKQRSKDLFRCLLELKAINIGGDHVVQEYLFLCKQVRLTLYYELLTKSE